MQIKEKAQDRCKRPAAMNPVVLSRDLRWQNQPIQFGGGYQVARSVSSPER
jgi:hypothetical protein